MNGLTLRINGGGSGKAKNTCYGVVAVTFPLEFVQKHAQKNEEFKEFFNSSTADDQLSKLRIILSGKANPDQDFIEFLVTVFLQAPAKHPVKCYLARAITKTKHLQPAFASSLSTAILALTTQASTLTQYTDVTGKLLTCIENFPTGAEALKEVEVEVAECMTAGLSNCVSTLSSTSTLSPTGKNEIFNLSHSALRLLLYIVQKISKVNSAKLTSKFKAIRASIKYLLFDDDVPMDTKSVCGILLLSMCVAEDGEGSWKDILQPDRQSDDMRVMLGSEAGRLALYSAIAIAVPTARLQNESVAGVPAIVALTHQILAIGERSSSDATFTLGVTRSILQIAKSLALVSESAIGLAIVDSILVFIWSHLEHYMDSVRHLTAQALGCVVKYCSRLRDEGNELALDNLFSALTCLDKGRKSYYVSVAALTQQLGARSMLARLPRLLPEMLAALSVPAVQACVSVALESLLPRGAADGPGWDGPSGDGPSGDGPSGDGSGAAWAGAILARVASCPLESSVLTVLENLLVRLVKADERLLDALLPNIKRTEDITSNFHGDLKCALMLLSVARKSGALATVASDHDESKWKSMIGYHVLKAAAVDAVDETRILSLSLIVESQKSTEPFSPGDLDFILYYLKYNINTQSPNFRQLTLSHLKKFIKRFDDSYKVMKRQKDPKHTTLKDDYYLAFLESLRKQCFDSLLQGSNYSRRYVGLQTLVWCEQLSLDGYSRVWKEDYVEKLLLHLEDSYENIKAYALEILEKCPVDLLQGKKYSVSLEIEDILRQASSVKPTDCTSAAYKLRLLKQKLPHVVLEENESTIPEAATFKLLTVLLEKLQSEIAQAERSILIAAARGPMYGLLHCMCYLLKELDADAISRSAAWRGLARRVLRAGAAAAAAVAAVVRGASPEGHLPMDRAPAPPALNGEPADGSQVTAQMVLLCAWRTVKEVSLLLGEVSCRLTVEGEGPESEGPGGPCRGTLTPEQLLQVGRYLTELLAETKHRGAFEQAYVGFTLLLTRLWRCRSATLHGAPTRWLNELLDILTRGDSSTLCSTRRGAGLPFMIQALVTTELQVNGNPRCFHHCMAALLRLARPGPARGARGDTRTHCLNILRALYRNTTLGESSAAYVGEGLLTAINGFDAPTWPERNSSTLLFSALAVRVFGVTRTRRGALCARNKMTGRIFFLRYPELYDFMLSKLQEVSSSEDTQQLRPSLYPVLLLLARLYPSALEGTVSNLKLVAFAPHVEACARSGQLVARRLAARAAVPLLPPERRALRLRLGLRRLADPALQRNYCHGILMQLVRLLDAKPEGLVLDPESAKDLSECIEGTLWILEQATGQIACYLIADEYVKVVNLILWKFPKLITENTSIHIENVLEKLLLCDDLSASITLGREVFLSNALYLYFIILYKKSATKTSQLIVRALKHQSYEVVLSSLNYLLILYQKCDRENFCCFQDHLEEITDRPKLLELLRNDQNYLQNLCHVLQNSGYLECVQKTLKVLSLERGTQMMIIGKQNELEMSKEEVIAELLRRVETENENVTHIYLDSLLKFVSETLQSVSKGNLLDIVRTVYASSSSENSEDVRAVAVEFLERNYRELLEMELDGLDGEEKFEYRSTVWSTLVTLLEDDSDTLRQKISDIVSELSQINTNGTARVIPSKSAELLRDFIGEHFGNVEERIAMFVVLALLDFKSEVCLTDDGNDEARVFDQNERYNIFLEENIWTNECAQKIRHICPAANTLDYINNVVNNSVYRKAIVELCNNNFKIFEGLVGNNKSNELGVNHDALNPKIALFVSKLQV